jgi:DNA-binding Xre family transcriptional regulator
MARRQPRKLGYEWQLRQLMATHDMFATTDLGPLLAERGVTLSAAQVYRLVTGKPERLSLHTLMALCDILGCTPNDLIEPVPEAGTLRRTQAAAGSAAPPSVKGRTPRRAEIRREG